VTDSISNTIQELSGKVFRLIHRIVSDREQAKDLTQDVFVKVLREPERVRDLTKLKPYIFRSAYNTALNFKRDLSRRQAKTEFIKEELTLVNPRQPDLLLESVEVSNHVKGALDSLADKQREALMLRFYSDLVIAEIADVMAVSQGSVKVHIARGLQNLKKCLLPILREEKS